MQFFTRILVVAVITALLTVAGVTSASAQIHHRPTPCQQHRVPPVGCMPHHTFP